MSNILNKNIAVAKNKILSSLRSDNKKKRKGSDRISIGLSGGAGVGKTEAIIQATKEYAEEQGLEWVESTTPTDKQFGFSLIQCSNVTASDLSIPTPSEDKSSLKYAFNDEVLPQRGQGVVFFDELSQGDNDVQKFVMAMARNREINGCHVPEDWTVLGAWNRTQDQAGANQLLKPLIDRFTNKINIEPDADAWLRWASANDVHPHILAFVKADNNMLCTLHDAPRGHIGSTPRTIEMLSDEYKNILDGDYKNCGLSDKEIFISVVGEEVGTSLKSFLKLVKEIPSIKEILKNPDEVRVVGDDEDGARCLVTFGLANKVQSEKEFKNSLLYLNKFGSSEYANVFATTLVARVPELADTKTFTDLKLTNHL